jgi:glycosyltransferase involved in cell wall biosynthesis
MNVIIYNYSDTFGGQERYVVDVMQGLIKLNYSVVFSGGPSVISGSKDTYQGSKIDVAIINGNKALYKQALKLNNGEFRIYVQHSDINDGQQSRFKRWVRKFLIKSLLHRVDLVVRVCDAALPNAYAPGKIETIYNGVQIQKSVVFKDIDIPIKLLMVGAINKNKNQRLAIEALTNIPNAELTIVGCGADKEELVELTKRLSLDSQVKWVGFVEDPSPYYRQAHLLLMLSKYEAFPYVVLEAMSNGVPVVAVPVGGVPEIIQTGENGWLIDSYSKDKLSNLINKISEDNDTYRTVSKEAVSTISTSFTKEKMINKLLAEIAKRNK